MERAILIVASIAFVIFTTAMLANIRRAEPTIHTPIISIERVSVDEQNSTQAEFDDFTQFPDSTPPNNLRLPIAAANIGLVNKFISPFGLVRRSDDHPQLGHGGIDLPTVFGAAIYAVSDGEITEINPSSDQRAGVNVKQFIKAGDQPGEAWIFLYEHIELLPNITVGTRVAAGQQIGISPLVGYDGSHHFQLSYAFNDLKYYNNLLCWPYYLNENEERALNLRFSEIKNDPEFISGWENSYEEGKYNYRALLSSTKLDGPLLCYPPGTNVTEA